MIWPSFSSPGPGGYDLFRVSHRLRLPARAVLDVGAHHGVDEDPAGVDALGVELAHGVEVLDLGDDVVGAHGRRHVEVARCATVDQVAPGVALVGAHDGDVAPHRRHQDVLAAVDLDDLLALFGDRADAGGRQKAAQAGAAAAHHLGEGALRGGFDLEPAFVHRLADVGRGADVAGDDLADLALVDELDRAALAVAGVVFVDGEIAHVHRLEMVDERKRVTLADEASDGDAHAALTCDIASSMGTTLFLGTLHSSVDGDALGSRGGPQPARLAKRLSSTAVVVVTRA